MLEHLFGSKTRLKLLRFFLNHPDQSFFVRELTRKLGLSINAVRRELEHLSAAQVVAGAERKEDLRLAEKKMGAAAAKRKYFRLNSQGSLTAELQSLILKDRLGRECQLIDALKGLGSIEYLLLSGRFAGIKESPTDLLIVGSLAHRDLEKLIKIFEKESDDEVRYTVMKKQEFLFRRNVADKFLSNLLNNKHLLIIDKIG